MERESALSRFIHLRCIEMVDNQMRKVDFAGQRPVRLVPQVINSLRRLLLPTPHKHLRKAASLVLRHAAGEKALGCLCRYRPRLLRRALQPHVHLGPAHALVLEALQGRYGGQQVDFRRQGSKAAGSRHDRALQTSRLQRNWSVRGPLHQFRATRLHGAHTRVRCVLQAQPGPQQRARSGAGAVKAVPNCQQSPRACLLLDRCVRRYEASGLQRGSWGGVRTQIPHAACRPSHRGTNRRDAMLWSSARLCPALQRLTSAARSANTALREVIFDSEVSSISSFKGRALRETEVTRARQTRLLARCPP